MPLELLELLTRNASQSLNSMGKLLWICLSLRPILRRFALKLDCAHLMGLVGLGKGLRGSSLSLYALSSSSITIENGLEEEEAIYFEGCHFFGSKFYKFATFLG